jgi:hypothetical protein
MITVEKAIAWQSNDCFDVEAVELTFSDEDIALIKKAQEFLINNPSMYKVVYYFDGYEFIEEEDAFIDLKTDVNQLYVFKNEVMFYCQNKYDSADQFEFDYVTNEELGL